MKHAGRRTRKGLRRRTSGEAPRIAIVVTACALPEYDRAIHAIRRTWGSHVQDQVDVFYAYGNGCDDHELADLGKYAGQEIEPVAEMQTRRVDDLLICGCSDLIAHQSDALLRKRLLALEYLVNHAQHAVYFMVCATSYVDQEALVDYVDSMDLRQAFHGPVELSEDAKTSFVSGSSMLLSRDVAEALSADRDRVITANRYHYADDVAISRWVSESITTTSVEEMVGRLGGGNRPTRDNTFRTLAAEDFVDLRTVGLDAMEPVSGAVHYHFAVDRIEDMESFHLAHYVEALPSVRALRGADMTGDRAESDEDELIFVQIASYRDPELPLTIASALSLAARPELLRFGICFQYDEETRGDLDHLADDARLGIDAIHHGEAKGLGWARGRANQMYDGETFLLQIDSHTRFGQDWDRKLIEMLYSIDDPKPLLTVYPPAYYNRPDGTEELGDSGIQRVSLVRLNPDLTTAQLGEYAPDDSRPGKSRFLAGGFIFTQGSFVTEVPSDPQIYFLGEEISLAIRAYTHGFNLYYPNENVIWHLYERPGPKHWTDHADWNETNDESVRRLQALLVGDAESLGAFGLGTLRTRQSYEDYAAVDFAARLDRSRRTETIAFQREIELDTSEIEPRSDYEVWAFALLSEDDVELARADIYDATVLTGDTQTVSVEAMLPEEPAKYLLWPKIRDGDWCARVIAPLPA